MNCARGGIIDEQALADALRQGIVASASLDVFSKEPCAGNPLLEFDNVVVTPHIGATTYEAQYRVGTDVASFVLAALRGEIAPNTVNLPCLMGDEIQQPAAAPPPCGMPGQTLLSVGEGACRTGRTHLQR